MNRWFPWTAALLWSAAAQAGTVNDTSYRDALGHRVQQLELTVPVPASKVWAALTTDQGFQSWAAPVAHVTLGNDGMIEASYRMDAKIGDPDNIRNRIVAYVPEHLLVLRNEHAPKNAPFDAEAFGRVRTIIELENVGNGRTLVRETSVGYDESAASESVFAHFQSGNAEEFKLLEKALISGPVDWKAEMADAQASIKSGSRP
ncbi:MAG TPA: SRPBCC domain-containing protein [Rhizomicrobium sp.]|nr:SRPBCC domain-containing protein [Rhizomicrobium sp.]